jgi:CheY-like chemotaxis protein/predicted regulator of Ras-like GTPase activity (Roadblock/LC7/MglB family)
MEKVLIAEDNPVLIKILKAGLKNYAGNFETLTAKDGEEAMQILEREPIALLVTDLQMPKVDGFSLLAYMKENHPEIPCIVMTAHGTPQLKEKLQQDVLSFIEKPFEIKDLAQTIIPALDRKSPDGSLQGISIASFLQMIEMEEKTCLFEVDSPEEGKGYFYFEKGILYDAVHGNVKGLEAAMQLIPMENAKISFKNVAKGKRKIARRIEKELIPVIMEAMRLKDESNIEEAADLQSTTDDLQGTYDFDFLETEDAFSEVLADDIFTMDTNSAEIFPEEADVPERTLREPAWVGMKDDAIVNLKGYINELKNINGYKASAILNVTGEVLESDSKDPNIDLRYISAMFNDIFLSANKACEKIGFKENRETTIVTAKGIVLMRSSGIKSRTRIHVIAILESDGNQALMKMEIERMIPAIVAELD